MLRKVAKANTELSSLESLSQAVSQKNFASFASVNTAKSFVTYATGPDTRMW